MGAVGTTIIALLNHPEALNRAHEEIDRVIKPGRLPDFTDEPSLPYVTAIVKETMRWRPTAPLGEENSLRCRCKPHLTTIST